MGLPMIGKRIKERRKAVGISAQQLADAIEVGVHTIWDYEAGRKRPSGIRLPALARALECTTDLLVSEEDSESRSEPRPIDKAPKETPRPTPLSEVPSERFLLELLSKQQDLIAEQTALLDRHRQDSVRAADQQARATEQQTALLERQRQDTSRLTEVIAQQQDLLVNERAFQQRQIEKQNRTIEQLTLKVELLEKTRTARGAKQLHETPVHPGRAGER